LGEGPDLDRRAQLLEEGADEEVAEPAACPRPFSEPEFASPRIVEVLWKAQAVVRIDQEEENFSKYFRTEEKSQARQGTGRSSKKKRKEASSTVLSISLACGIFAVKGHIGVSIV
jgi:hypothetical protein